MKRIISLVFSLLILALIIVFPAYADEPSEWARKEVMLADEAGLAPGRLENGYRSGITRKEFAIMFSRLAEKLLGEALLSPGADRKDISEAPEFCDTSDPDVLAAAGYGLINGYRQSDGTYAFKPDNTLKRAEAAAMINRLARLCGKKTNGYSRDIRFMDVKTHWVWPQLGFPVRQGIMKGTSDKYFSPEKMLTGEEAVLIVYRTYLVLNDIFPDTLMPLDENRDPYAGLNVREALLKYTDIASSFVFDYEMSDNDNLTEFINLCAPVNIYLPSGAVGHTSYNSEPSVDNMLGAVKDEFGFEEDLLSVRRSDISVYCIDLLTGDDFGYREDKIWDSASLAKVPYLLSVLEMLEREKPDDLSELDQKWIYDPSYMFVPGSGKIQLGEVTECTWGELFRLCFTDSDNIAYNRIKCRYGLSSYIQLMDSLAIPYSLSDERLLSARSYGIILKEAYEFMESGSEYGRLMKEWMTSAFLQNAVGKACPDLPVAHKYGWDIGAYHDMAVVYDTHPFAVVVMTDCDRGEETTDRFIADVVNMCRSFMN